MSRIYKETSDIEQSLQRVEELMSETGLRIYVGTCCSIRVCLGEYDGVVRNEMGQTMVLPRMTDDERIWVE